jgi:hypothetical protein
MSHWQERFVISNKKLKAIDPLVTETEKKLRLLRKILKNTKDESIDVTLDSAMENLKQIKKIITARHLD